MEKTMRDIPDEVIEAVTGMHPEQREYPDDVRKDFHAAAEWARKEALREAEEMARREASEYYDTPQIEAVEYIADAIRALAKGGE